MSTKSIYSSIRKPEYTGENRCVPCTVVNVVIAAAVSGVLGLVSVPLAVVALPMMLGVIYVRGYLVPGTPTLTKTYFPDRVLRWFDKDPDGYGVHIETGTDIDVETVLQDAGVLEKRDGDDDLALDAEFRGEWHAEIGLLDEQRAQDVLGVVLGIKPSRISVLPRSRSFEVKVDGDVAGKWESSEAFIADMAAERVLNERVDNWTDLSVERRSGLLRGVRVYLEQCPRCQGTVVLSDETVKSCCRSRQVLASRCEDCGVRLFEINATAVENTAT